MATAEKTDVREFISSVIDNKSFTEFLQKVVFKSSRRKTLKDANIDRISNGLAPLEEGEEAKIFANFPLSESESSVLLESFGSRIEIEDITGSAYTIWVYGKTERTKKDGSKFIAEPTLNWVQSSKVLTNLDVILNPDTFKVVS